MGRDANDLPRAAGLFPIAERYELVSGWLVPRWAKTGPVSAYYPEDTPSVVGDLAKVYTGMLTPLGYVCTYGLLGHRRFIDNEIGNFTLADQLDWFLAQARTVATLQTLLKGLNEDPDVRDESLDHCLRKFDPGPYAFGDQLYCIEVNYPISSDHTGGTFSASMIEREPASPPDQPPAKWLTEYVENRIEILGEFESPVAGATLLAGLILDRNISGIHPQMTWIEQTGEFGLRFHFPSLLSVIYWHLANVARNGHLRSCEECGALFVATDKRQRFCPPPGTLKESRCAVRARARARYRAKRQK